MARRDLTLDWQATLFAGLIAGTVYLLLELLLLAVTGKSIWGLMRMIAGIVMGRSALTPPGTFDPLVVLVALLVHYALSIVYALLLAVIVRWAHSLAVAVAIGVAFGLALYLINYYAVADAAFPWFRLARSWISLFSHIGFGAALGATYWRLAMGRGHAGIA